MSKPRSKISREQTIENVLDKLSELREELLKIERSLERIQTAKGRKSGV